VARHLEVKDMLRCAVVCRCWQQVFRADILWRPLFQNTFGTLKRGEEYLRDHLNEEEYLEYIGFTTWFDEFVMVVRCLSFSFEFPLKEEECTEINTAKQERKPCHLYQAKFPRDDDGYITSVQYLTAFCRLKNISGMVSDKEIRKLTVANHKITLVVDNR